MNMGEERSRYDVVCVGGGLSNAMIALYLRRFRPELRLAVVERDAEPCGNHTWCFHSGDVHLDDFQFLKSCVGKSWPGYRVRFPTFERRIGGGYHAVRSTDLALHLRNTLRDDLFTGVSVVDIGDHGVRLSNGCRLQAPIIFDGSGPPMCRSGVVAYQKFLGLELELSEPHGIREPVLMDSAHPQLEGFRFFYLLPWNERRLLVEDTRYSDDPSIDTVAFRGAIQSYVAERGWRIDHIVREEAAALPLPLVENFRRAPARAGAFSVGMAAGLFHPTTGYSFPDSVRVAGRLARLKRWDAGEISVLMQQLRQEMRGRRFFRFLNRMLFRGAAPEQRYRVLEKFYRLPAPLIERFYRAELRPTDYLRILGGRPPIPVTEALRCLSERAAERDGFGESVLVPLPTESHA